MNTGLIPVRYATALLDFAAALNLQEKVYDEAKLLARHFETFPRLRSVLENPVLATTEKRKIILTAAGADVSNAFQRFVELLLANNREAHLQEIVLKYMSLYRKKNNIYSGRVTTVSAIDPATQDKLIKLVEHTTGGTIEIENYTNPEIIGGFLFEVDFVRWDASIAGQLRRIRNEYIEKNKKTV